MTTSQAQLLRERDLAEATGRALSGDRSLRLGPDPDFDAQRGSADARAQRLLHSDPELFASTSPAADAARLVFDLLEQVRCESLATLPGVTANLRRRHARWTRRCLASGLTETRSGLLLLTVAEISRSRITRAPITVEVEDLIEDSRFELAPLIGSDLARLRRHRDDQAAYAEPARSLAETVATLLTSYDEPAISPRTAGFAELLAGDGGDDADPTPGTARAAGTTPAAGYTVFTRAHDRERAIADLVRPAQLAELRGELGDHVRAARVNVPRLARALERLLAEPVRGGWDDGQEQGLVDGRRLSQLVSSPTERRLFRTERDDPRADCLVTLLLDCSGSMRRHRALLGVVVDVLTRALDLAGVGTEVLGFSTGSWNGGQAMRDWARAGRPTHPGRLADVSHLVLKDADTPWRRARRDLGGLLREDLYREGVDGEAVAWACRRMHVRPEERRLLLVVSDGGPSESATALTTGEGYLDRHLREVVRLHEAAGTARIHAVGLGQDLSAYYPRTLHLDPETPLGTHTFGEIVALIGGARR